MVVCPASSGVLSFFLFMKQNSKTPHFACRAWESVSLMTYPLFIYFRRTYFVFCLPRLSKLDRACVEGTLRLGVLFRRKKFNKHICVGSHFSPRLGCPPEAESLIIYVSVVYKELQTNCVLIVFCDCGLSHTTVSHPYPRMSWAMNRQGVVFCHILAPEVY